MKSIAVSVVTPSYNQGRFIEETIKSVISQEGDFYIDYVVMDGGSSDNTVDILKKYESLLHDKKLETRCLGIDFRWVSENDGGQSDAVDKGIRMATGDIIAWINSDDYYPSNDVFQTVVQRFSENGDIDIVYGNGVMVDVNKEYIRDFKSRQIALKDIPVHPSSLFNQPALFFRKNIYFTSGGLDKTLNWTMDYDLWFRLFLQSRRYVYIDKTFSCARYHEDAKSVEHMWVQIIETCRVKKKYMASFNLGFADILRLYFNMASLFVYYYAVKLGFKKAC